jgi:EmrB/QacA subfamily drug resistance transporter
MAATRKIHKTWTLVAVCMGTFMLLLNVTVVVVALPDMRTALHAGFQELQWTYDAYALSLASLLLAAGTLADIYGRKLVFTTGLCLFTLALPLCAAAQSAVMLIVCQAILGVGGAAMFATALALLAQTFQGRQRGDALGVWGLVTGVATGLGPVLGGLLVGYLSWRWVFLVNIPVGITAIVITAIFVREWRPPQARRLDVPGLVLFTAGLLSLVFGLIRAGQSGWTDTTVLACLAAAVILLAGFVAAERRSDHPMFDLGLFRVPSFLGAAAGAFGIQVSLYATIIYLVIYLQKAMHLSAVQTGLCIAAITGATMITAPLAGRLSTRMPVRLLVGGGLIVTGIGLLMMRGLEAGSTWQDLLPGFIVAGLASGLVNAPVASTAIGVVPPPKAGMGSGINNTFRQVGIATGVAALGSILASHLAASGGPSPASYASGMNLLMLITAILALVTGALALALIRGRDFVGQARQSEMRAAAAAAAAAAPTGGAAVVDPDGRGM